MGNYPLYKNRMNKIKLGVCNACDCNCNGECINDKDNNHEECIYANEIAESVYNELFDENGGLLK